MKFQCDLTRHYIYNFPRILLRDSGVCTSKIWRVQVGCMRQVLGPGALGRPRGIRRRGRWEGDRDGEYM